MNKMRSLLGGLSSDHADRSLRNETPSSPGSLEIFARRWLDKRAVERRLRIDFFAPEVVNEQGWLILLELYRAELHHPSVTADQIAQSSDLPLSTVLRYAEHLATHDLIKSYGSTADSMLSLSEHGARKIRSYFSKLSRYQHADIN